MKNFYFLFLMLAVIVSCTNQDPVSPGSTAKDELFVHTLPDQPTVVMMNYHSSGQVTIKLCDQTHMISVDVFVDDYSSDEPNAFSLYSDIAGDLPDSAMVRYQLIDHTGGKWSGDFDEGENVIEVRMMGSDGELFGFDQVFDHFDSEHSPVFTYTKYPYEGHGGKVKIE